MDTISLKLLVDKQKNKVVFAESDKDFVDVLFSFLTLPMGTIIRLLDKQSSVGCMDKLYESVENLDAMYLETEACKTMLLQPRSAAEILCEDLVINIDDLHPRLVYICPSFDCFNKTHRNYSSICGAHCSCGKPMDTIVEWIRRDDGANDGVFLQGRSKYIITDALNVAPATIAATVSIYEKLGIKSTDALEKKVVNVHREEVLSLLKRLLLSKMPLTDVFLRKPNSVNKYEQDKFVGIDRQIKRESKDGATSSQTTTVKLLQNRSTKNVVYAEAGPEFVDILFSFLTFPLGSIVKLLDRKSSITCVDNLYHSVEALAVIYNKIKSSECKNMLLAPKLYPHFCCSNQLMNIGVERPREGQAHGCEICWNDSVINCSTKCKHNIDSVELTEIDPKVPKSGTGGGGYAKRSGWSETWFMVTNEILVTPHSPIYGFDMIKELKEPISSLEQKEVIVGEDEAINLLRACLISRTALTDVFSSH